MLTPFTAWLKSMSTITAWKDPMSVGHNINGAFAPETTPAGMTYFELILPQNTALYEARYGAGSKSAKGNLVGERYSEVFVIDAIQAGLAGVPAGYVPTLLDGFDVCMLQYGWGSIFDTFFVSEYHKRHPVDAPPPVNPPPAPGPINPPPLPPPTTPPPTVPPVTPPPAPAIKVPDAILETAKHIGGWLPAKSFPGKHPRAVALGAWVVALAADKAK